MTESPWHPDVDGLRVRLERSIPALQALTAVHADEDDTRNLIADVLRYVLGYAQRELRTEYMLPNGLIDFGVRVGARTYWYLEVKPIGHHLQASDLEAVEERAQREHVRWAVLTNGRFWQIYHLVPGGTTLAIEVDLLATEVTFERKAYILSMLHREYVWRFFDELAPPTVPFTSRQPAPRVYVPTVTAPIPEPELYIPMVRSRPDTPVSISGVSVIVPVATNARMKPAHRALVACGVIVIAALLAAVIYQISQAAGHTRFVGAGVAAACALISVYFFSRLARGRVSRLFYSRPRLFGTAVVAVAAAAGAATYIPF